MGRAIYLYRFQVPPKLHESPRWKSTHLLETLVTRELQSPFWILTFGFQRNILTDTWCSLGMERMTWSFRSDDLSSKQEFFSGWGLCASGVVAIIWIQICVNWTHGFNFIFDPTLSRSSWDLLCLRWPFWKFLYPWIGMSPKNASLFTHLLQLILSHSPWWKSVAHTGWNQRFSYNVYYISKDIPPEEPAIISSTLPWPL